VFAVPTGQLLLLGPVALFAGLGLSYGVLSRWDAAVAISAWGAAFLGVLGVALATAGAFMLVRGYRHRGLAVLVFPAGLVYRHPGGAEALPWGEVTAVWGPVPGRVSGLSATAQDRTEKVLSRSKLLGHAAGLLFGDAELCLRRSDGRGVTIPGSVTDTGDLFHIIQQETLPHLLARVVADWEAGETVNFESSDPDVFSSLRVSKEGLSTDKESLTWAEIQGVWVKDRTLWVGRRSEEPLPLEVHVFPLANLHVLLGLTDHVLSTGRFRAGADAAK
jgi:hypothetical protein